MNVLEASIRRWEVTACGDSVSRRLCTLASRAVAVEKTKNKVSAFR